MEDESEGLKERVQAAGGQAVTELANALLENPLFNQALGAAFGAKEKAGEAQRAALQALDLPSGSDVSRLERRLRSLSERVEAVENELDRVVSDLRALREATPPEA